MNRFTRLGASMSIAVAVGTLGGVLAACATTPQTYQQKLDVATVAVQATCDAADVLTQTGDLKGQDAERVIAACAAAKVVLADLQATAPLPASAASSPG